LGTKLPLRAQTPGYRLESAAISGVRAAAAKTPILNDAASAPLGARTHDPLAMQKIVGSSPIIRFQKSPAPAEDFSRPKQAEVR